MKLFGQLLVNRDCYPGDSSDDDGEEASVNFTSRSTDHDVRDAVEIEYAEVLFK